jgi:hypothetical protein
LFHGGTGKISFLTSENEKKHFLGDIWNLSLYLDYLFIYLFTGQLPPGGYPIAAKYIISFIYLSISRSLAEPLTMFWNSEWAVNTALDSCKAGFRPFECFLVVHVSLSSGFVTQFTRTSEDNLTTSYKRHCMETYVCPGG